MKTETQEYFRLARTEQNMFIMETIEVRNGKIVKTESTEPTYLPIAFDRLRRKTGESFFRAVQENI